MVDDVMTNKAESIERCLKRIKDETIHIDWVMNYTQQDAVVLNIQRACELILDMAMHLVRIKKLGVPQNSRDAFVLLEKNGYLSPEMSLKMQKMVGFRNIAVHDYTDLNLDIVQNIIQKHLGDFLECSRIFVKL